MIDISRLVSMQLGMLNLWEDFCWGIEWIWFRGRKWTQGQK